jgi:hypothetical protein
MSTVCDCCSYQVSKTTFQVKQIGLGITNPTTILQITNLNAEATCASITTRFRDPVEELVKGGLARGFLHLYE